MDEALPKAVMPSVSPSNFSALFALVIQGAPVILHTRLTTKSGLVASWVQWDVTGIPHPPFLQTLVRSKYKFINVHKNVFVELLWNTIRKTY